ncbi:MAG: hypothetical protein ACHBN1_24800 [Heteroscytonema crispum UTEX LB 1556]
MEAQYMPRKECVGKKICRIARAFMPNPCLEKFCAPVTRTRNASCKGCRETLSAGATSRRSLSAVAHGGNPQDRAASPTHCFTNALASLFALWVG